MDFLANRVIEQQATRQLGVMSLMLRYSVFRSAGICLTLAALLTPGCRSARDSHQEYLQKYEYGRDAESPEPPRPRTVTPANWSIPKPPSNLTDDRPDVAKRLMTITEAIALALENNPNIQVSDLQSKETANIVDLAKSAFDPTISLGGNWANTESQVLNTVEGPGPGIDGTSVATFGPASGSDDLIMFSRKMKTGGSVNAGFGTTYTFTEPAGAFLTENPAVRSTLSVQANQPLFRGRGRDVNMIGIRIAEQVSSSTTLQSQVEINKTIVDTATAYWKLYGSIAELTSQDKGLAEARETWEKEKKKLILGESSKTQIAEAREQYERFRANRALIRKEVADSERALRRILSIAQEDKTRIVPTTVPQTTEPTFNWEEGYKTAFCIRPEIKVQQAFVNMARLKLKEACDLKRLNVNGFLGMSLSGAGSSFDDALETLESNKYQSWSAGISMDHQFGRRRAKALIRQREIGLAREIKSMKAVRDSILADLHESYQAVTNAWHIMQLQKDRQQAADTILSARRSMYEVGEISLEVYLRGISGASNSAAEERAAIARFNQALIRWEFAKGTIMNFANVHFETAEPPGVDAERTSTFIDDYLSPNAVRQDEGIQRQKLPGSQPEPVPFFHDPQSRLPMFVEPIELNPVPSSDNGSAINNVYPPRLERQRPPATDRANESDAPRVPSAPQKPPSGNKPRISFRGTIEPIR